MLSLDKVKELVYNHLHMHENRYIHTLGVVKMAKYLANKLNYDETKAEIAAYMHDYSKYDDIKTAVDLLTEKEINECEEYPFLYHAYLSAENYKLLGGEDEDIYLAIKYHVFGRPKMSTLEKIIMIADYTEENRKYESCIECRNILLNGDVDLAIYKSLLYTSNHVSEIGGAKVHPVQYEVLKEYESRVKKMTLEEVIIECLGKVKAHDIITYDTKEKSPFYDKIIVASVSSDRQASGVVSYLEDLLPQNNYKIRSVEGKDSAWVLVDMYDIILQVFTDSEREYFDIDKIYMEYPKNKIED